MRARSIVCLVALGAIVCTTSAFGQALMDMQAVGLDGSGSISGDGKTVTLTDTPADIAIDILLSGWGSQGETFGYNCQWECPTLGTLAPNGDFCADFATNTCQGVDESRGDYILQNANVTLPICNNTSACPDATIRKFSCGSAVIVGANAPDPGTAMYGARLSIHVPAGTLATTTPRISTGAEGGTWQHGTGDITYDVSGITIIIETGRCCGDPGGFLECSDGVTAGTCAAAGGAFTPGASCSGVDVNPADGIDDACPCLSDADCNDNDACTDDACNVGTGICSNLSNVPGGQCCNSGNGALTPIDDGNQCTGDDCNADGSVSHPVLAGDACDDDNGCTVLDTCLADASCAGVDANAQFCDDTTPCDAGSCNLTTNLCECSLTTDVTLDPRDSSKPDGNCFPEGEAVIVDVNMGAGSETVTGAQFRVLYDPTCLEFTGMDTSAVFPQILFIDVVDGRIFAAVGVDHIAGGAGTQGPETLATLNFDKLAGCGECNLCFEDANPMNTILSNDEGNPVPIETACSKMIRLAGDITLNIPANTFTNPDCDAPTAIVTWGDITASDTCDVDAPVIDCLAVHDGGLDLSGLIANGGEFPQGETIITCTATNSCGNVEELYWTVDVSDQHSLDIVVQLSPAIAGDPITRCIDFEFFSDCVNAPWNWSQTLTFGGPYDFVGHATPDGVKIPKGQYACLTAKDPLHTLRAVSMLDCVGNTLIAEFKGDPDLGGNWLVGGNLDSWKANGNGDNIDILDFGMFVSVYLDAIDPNSPCGTDGPHGDINGDGLVDGGDFAFISENFLDASKNSCCADGAASVPVGLESITVKELRLRGLGDLAVADLNGDGVLDRDDMAEAMAGNIPTRGTKRPARAGVRSSLGN